MDFELLNSLIGWAIYVMTIQVHKSVIIIQRGLFVAAQKSIDSRFGTDKPVTKVSAEKSSSLHTKCIHHFITSATHIDAVKVIDFIVTSALVRGVSGCSSLIMHSIHAVIRVSNTSSDSELINVVGRTVHVMTVKIFDVSIVPV